MKRLLKNFVFIITIVALAHSADAMKNITMFHKVKTNYIKREGKRKTFEYAMKLLADQYEMNNSIPESAIERLRNMPWEDFSQHLYNNISNDTYYKFLEYIVEYYKQVHSKRRDNALIGMRNKDKEQHEGILNNLIPVCKKLGEKQKRSGVIENVDNKEVKKVSLITDEDLENAIFDYTYDDTSDNDIHKNDRTENTVIQEKKIVDTKPTSPAINIIKTTNTYSPGKENYVPLKITKVKNTPEVIQLCNISFENKKVKTTFINHKKREEINYYLNNNNETITKAVEIVNENKSDEDNNTILSRNPNTVIKNIKQYFVDKIN